MTSTNLNQFMRSKINLNSQVLSKNTSEIISTCIERLYKQTPNKFKNDLQKIRVAATRKENPAPLRVLKTQEYQRQQKLSLEPRFKTTNAMNIDEALLLRSVVPGNKKRIMPHVANHKKLLKSNNYKVNSARRFGSSASSSSGSLWRRREKRDQGHTKPIAMQHAAFAQPKKSYSMLHGPQKKMSQGLTLHTNVTSLVMPARNQHMTTNLGSIPHAIQVSSNIQRDLMVIDDLLKKRLKNTDLNWKTHSNKAATVFKQRNVLCFDSNTLQQQHINLEKITHTKTLKTPKAWTKILNPNVADFSSKMLRKRFAQPVTVPKDTPKPLTSFKNEREFFAKHKPLRELDEIDIPNNWNRYKPTQVNHLPAYRRQMATTT